MKKKFGISTRHRFLSSHKKDRILFDNGAGVVTRREVNKGQTRKPILSILLIECHDDSAKFMGSTENTEFLYTFCVCRMLLINAE